jgi:hypothetical protein
VRRSCVHENRLHRRDPRLKALIDGVFTGDLISNPYKEARGEKVIPGNG